jgi:hypothetical protein
MRAGQNPQRSGPIAQYDRSALSRNLALLTLTSDRRDFRKRLPRVGRPSNAARSRCFLAFIDALDCGHASENAALAALRRKTMSSAPLAGLIKRLAPAHTIAFFRFSSTLSRKAVVESHF